MGGKRPDQYRIAPDEAGATDYKTLPNTPAEATESDRTFSEAMETWSRENQPTPPDVIEPKARKRRAEQRRKAKAAQESASKQEAEDGSEEEAGEGESESTQTT